MFDVRRLFRTPFPSSGFTLVEVLLALLLIATLMTAVCHSLVTLLRADRMSGDLHEAPCLLRSIATGFSLGIAATNAVPQGTARWAVYEEDQESTPADPASRWKLWILQPTESRAGLVTLSLRAVDPP